MGTENDEYLGGGSGSNRYLGLAGADTITLGSGIDVVAYTALTESQIPASDASIFRGDVINGFEIGTDLIELPTLPVGNLTIDVTIPFAFSSTFASTLTASQALTTALSGADDDAAYVTVTDGNAAGDYLIVQGTASTAGFDPTSDLIVKLEDVDDTVTLTGASTISDLFVA